MFTAYLCERFPLRIFGSAAIGITAAVCWVGGGVPTAGSLVFATALSVLLLLQFRMWDDLEDRASDSVSHPVRVLVRSEVAPFRRSLISLAIVNVVLCGTAESAAAIMIGLLDLGFYCAYRWARRCLPDVLWRFSILLLKYPAFVVVVATVLGTSRPGRLAAAAAAAYSTACAYEALHGRSHLEGVTS